MDGARAEQSGGEVCELGRREGGGGQEAVNGSMEVIIWCLPFGQVTV